jgi:hypothetical protein
MIWLERRWVMDVLSGFTGAEEADSVLAPRPNEVDYVGAYSGMLRNGSFLAGIGMRVALLFCASSPLWLTGRLRRFRSLSGTERSKILDRLLSHRIYIVAELTLLMKLCACMALFRSETVRERSNYDSTPEPSRNIVTTGARLKRGLPIAQNTPGVTDEEVA